MRNGKWRCRVKNIFQVLAVVKDGERKGACVAQAAAVAAMQISFSLFLSN